MLLILPGYSPLLVPILDIYQSLYVGIPCSSRFSWIPALHITVYALFVGRRRPVVLRDVSLLSFVAGCLVSTALQHQPQYAQFHVEPSPCWAVRATFVVDDGP